MLVNYIKDFLNPSDFHLDIYNDKIHINNYEKILSLGTTKTIIKTKNSKITLVGNDFSLSKLENNELLITGKLESLNIVYE